VRFRLNPCSAPAFAFSMVHLANDLIHRQVQDLQVQLVRAQHHISRLKALVGDDTKAGSLSLDEDVPTHSGVARRTRLPPLRIPNIGYVRQRIHTMAAGLFAMPLIFGASEVAKALPSNIDNLPPRSISDHFLTSYYNSTHQVMPILSWVSFHQDVQSLYDT